MKIEERRLQDIKPYEKNPRRNDEAVEKVAASLREFGWQQPIVLDKDGVIIAGHTRLKAAESLGLETAPCVIAEDLTEEEVRAYRLADNKTAEFAGWDFGLLDEELAQISAIDMEAFGFDLTEPEDPEDIEEDDYDPEEPVKARAKTGDVFLLGDHKLVCGDSTKPEDIARLFAGVRPLLVFTDPPYGVAIGSKNKRINEVDPGRGGRVTQDIENDTIEKEELRSLLTAAFTNLREAADPACSYYVTAPQGGELGQMMLEMMAAAGLPVRHQLVWVKNAATFSMGRLDYDYRHEPIFYTWTDKHIFYGGFGNTVIDDTKRLEELNKEELKDLGHALQEGREQSVIYCDKPLHSVLHPTMKPVKLVARFIINSSKEGDPVADIFGGSGTTMIAAEQLNRRCYMMEMDPHYCDVIIDRWERFTGRAAEKITP